MVFGASFMAQMGLTTEAGEPPAVSQTQEQRMVTRAQARGAAGVQISNQIQTTGRPSGTAVTPQTPHTGTNAAIAAITDAEWTPANQTQQRPVQQDTAGQGGGQASRQINAPQGVVTQDGGSALLQLYPASVAKKLATRKQSTPEQNKREFGWQARAKEGEDQKKLSEEFKDDFLRDTVNLHLFVFMTSASPHLQILHSVAKFYALGGNAALQHKPIGWVGDRTAKRPMPMPVFVPKQNGWTWSTVQASLSEAVAVWWYGDENNAGKLRYDNEHKEDVSLPLLLFLPSCLGTFVTQAKRTPWELYVEIKRRAEDGTHGFTMEDCEMQREWCLAAGQTADEGKNKPVVQIAMQAVTLDDDAFDDWAFNRLESTLGPLPTEAHSTGVGAGQGALPANPQAFAGMMESAQAIQQMATAVQRMSEQQLKMGTTVAGGSSGTQQKTEVFTVYRLAALMGWCCITEEEQVPPIWGLILQTKDMEDVRLNIWNAIQHWAETMKVELNVGVYFTDKMLKALVEMRPNAGGGMATLESTGKALSIMACMRRTASEIEDIKVKKKAEQETTSVRTMGEAIVLEGGEKKNPPLNYSDLKRTVGTFTGLIYVLYGAACDFYKKLWGIYKALKHERVAEMEDKFTGTFCKQIVWAIISDKCDYFSTRIHPDAFKNDLDEPDFPLSGLSTIIPNCH